MRTKENKELTKTVIIMAIKFIEKKERSMEREGEANKTIPKYPTKKKGIYQKTNDKHFHDRGLAIFASLP